MPDTPVTSREFEMLRGDVQGLHRRIDEIDSAGTRGVIVVAAQVTEIAKDFAKHEVQHEIQAKRWWSVIIAVAVEAVAIVGQYYLLVRK